MDTQELIGALDFLRAAERLKTVTRSGYTSEGHRESVAEHTWRLCLMALLFRDELPGADFARLVSICIVHDLGEAIGGDVPAPEQVGTPSKAAGEREDLLSLLAPLPERLRAGIVELWDEYEAARSPEARLAKALDKLETILQHTQGRNPEDFDYRFNLGYGRRYTAEPPLIAAVREVLDRETERRAREAESRPAAGGDAAPDEPPAARRLLGAEGARMLAGEPYDPMDPALVAARARARDLCQALNATREADTDARRRLLVELLGAGGDSVWMQPPFSCDYGCNIELGERVFFNFGCVVLDVCRVKVGSFTLFGPAVQIYTPLHPLDAERRRREEYGRPVEIGSDVWVGGGAIILPGVTIGSRAVIGAGSVVTRDVPEGVFAAGNPCRVIRDLAG